MMHLVTGGAGYFGETVAAQLAAAGERVRVFDLNPYEGEHRDRIEVMRGDIRDADAVAKACAGVTVLMHNVAQVPLAKNPDLFWSVNRDGVKVALAAAKKAGVKKFVYTSSSAVFGIPKTNPVNEDTLPTPAEDYGRAKYEGEVLCRAAAAEGLDVSIVRPRTIVGRGRLGVFQLLFEWIRLGHNVPVFDGGKNIYQFVHTDDLADACLKAARRAGPATYNIGAAEYGSLHDTLAAVCAHAGTGSRVKSLPMAVIEPLMNLTSALGLSPLGPYHAKLYGRSLYFDVRKAQSELGWQPRYSNISAMMDSYDWYVKNREEVMSRKEASTHRSAMKEGILKLVPRFL